MRNIGNLEHIKSIIRTKSLTTWFMRDTDDRTTLAFYDEEAGGPEQSIQELEETARNMGGIVLVKLSAPGKGKHDSTRQVRQFLNLDEGKETGQPIQSKPQPVGSNGVPFELFMQQLSENQKLAIENIRLTMKLENDDLDREEAKYNFMFKSEMLKRVDRLLVDPKKGASVAGLDEGAPMDSKAAATDQEEKNQRILNALQRLAKHVPDLEVHLEKLADKCEKEPENFKMMLTMLG